MNSADMGDLAMRLARDLKKIPKKAEPKKRKRARPETADDEDGADEMQVVKTKSARRLTVTVKSKRTPQLLGMLHQSVNVSDMEPTPYLPKIFFDKLLGKLSFALPKEWPRGNVVKISNYRKSSQAENNSLNFLSVAFLQDPKKTAQFKLFLLLVARNQKCIYNIGGYLGFKLRAKPTCALDALYKKYVWQI